MMRYSQTPCRPAVFPTWNDYFPALIMVSDPSHQPVTLGLGAFSGRYLVQLNLYGSLKA
jgi:ABC-type glycerol-3-phosphate transport system permease component